MQQISNVIVSTATPPATQKAFRVKQKNTIQTAFRAIEKRIARTRLGAGISAASDDKPDLRDDTEVAAQRSIDELGFILRAPKTALGTVPFVLGLMVHSRAYHLDLDVIHDRYKDEIVDPWIKSLKEEGEKSLIGTIEFSSKVAKDLVTSALEREDNRYMRELEEKHKPVDRGTVQRLIAIYGNLVAAEEALKELFIRVEGLQAQSGQ